MAARDTKRQTPLAEETPNPPDSGRDSSPNDFEREHPPLPPRGTVGEVNESLEDTYPMTDPSGDPEDVDLNLDPMDPEDRSQSEEGT